jgi:hypothetical protein
MRAVFLFFCGAVFFFTPAHAGSVPSGAKCLSSDYTLTIYFTPIEKEYTETAGFRSPSMRISAVPRRLSPDFVQAVRMEGYGRLLRPTQGMSYLHSDGAWTLASAPLGLANHPLVPQISCGIGSESNLRPGDWIALRSPTLPASLQSHAWRVDDCGAGVGPRQIDLYWGEDVSKGPGTDLDQAAHAPISHATAVSVYRVPPPH